MNSPRVIRLIFKPVKLALFALKVSKVEFDTLDSYFVRVSLDHLIGEREQPVRNLKAERLGGLNIDHQFDFRRL